MEKLSNGAPYSPNLPSLRSLGCDAVYGTVQDAINSAIAVRSLPSNSPQILDVKASDKDGQSSIDAVLGLSPVLELLSTVQDGNVVVNLHLTRITAGSTMTLKGVSTGISGWKIVLQGTLGLVQSIAAGSEPRASPNHSKFIRLSEADASQNWTVKLGDADNISVIAANLNKTAPPIADVVSKNMADFKAVMQSYWSGLTLASYFDLFSVSWPWPSTPKLICSAWKIASEAEYIDGVADGINRPTAEAFRDVVSNGGDQLLVVSSAGTTIPTPKNWVPLDSGSTLVIGCDRFLEGYLQMAIFYSMSLRFDELDEHNWQLRGKPVPYIPEEWQLASWTPAGELTWRELRTLTFHDTRYELPAKAPSAPTIDILTTATMSCPKTNTINITADVSTPSIKPGLHYAPSVDIVMAGVGTDGVITFIQNGSDNPVTGLEVSGPNAPPDYYWNSFATTIEPFTGFYTSLIAKIPSIQHPLKSPPLPGAKFWSMRDAYISQTTFDFVVSLSLILPPASKQDLRDADSACLFPGAEGGSMQIE